MLTPWTLEGHFDLLIGRTMSEPFRSHGDNIFYKSFFSFLLFFVITSSKSVEVDNKANCILYL